MIIKIYYIKKWKYRPKIIYALPFISIGTQVAEQIQKIFENESSKNIHSGLMDKRK